MGGPPFGCCLVVRQLHVQQRAGEPPLPLHRGHGDIEGGGRLADGHAREVSEHDDSGLARVVALEAIERLVQGQDVDGGSGNGRRHVVQVQALAAATPFEAGLAPGLVDQDLTHGLGGGPEEMPAAVPARLVVPEQTQVRLVDEGRGLERRPRAQHCHPRLGDPVQLAVDQRQQLGGSIAVAVIGGVQEVRDRPWRPVGHPHNLRPR